MNNRMCRLGPKYFVTPHIICIEFLSSAQDSIVEPFASLLIQKYALREQRDISVGTIYKKIVRIHRFE